MNIYMKCFRDHHNLRSLHKDETICMMTGSLADVQHGTMELVKRINEYYESIGKNYSRYAF